MCILYSLLKSNLRPITWNKAYWEKKKEEWWFTERLHMKIHTCFYFKLLTCGQKIVARIVHLSINCHCLLTGALLFKNCLLTGNNRTQFISTLSYCCRVWFTVKIRPTENLRVFTAHLRNWCFHLFTQWCTEGVKESHLIPVPISHLQWYSTDFS